MIVKADDYNSRTHTECDRAAEVRIAEAKHYNSRTHTECDNLVYPPSIKEPLLQFPHPYRVRF